MHRLQHLVLFGADRISVKRVRWLHRGQAEELKDMVWHHVAQRTGCLIEFRTQLDAHCFRHSDLHVVDVVAVPNRLEDPVGEPQYHNVLDRLLAEEMIHSIDLRF